MMQPMNSFVVFSVYTFSPSTGALKDADELPTFAVYLNQSALPVVENFMTKPVGTTGEYIGSFQIATIDGFDPGDCGRVIASATVDGLSAKKEVRCFRVAPQEETAGVPVVELTQAGVAAVVSEFGTGATLTECHTASGYATPTDVQDALTNYGAAVPGDIPTASQNASAVAAAILATPANKIGTDSSGNVTLSADSQVLRSEAKYEDEDTYVTIPRYATRRLCKRVRKNTGADIKQADVDSIAYTIYLVSERDKNDWTPIENHTDVDLTVSDVILDALTTDGYCTDYNFTHEIDISEHQAFTLAGRRYLVLFTITPDSGQVILARFWVDCI